MRGRSVIDTILVIDDEEPFCRSIQRLQETSGRRVVWALDGKAGLEMAIRDAPQVILLDVRMAGMNGIETLQLLSGNPATSGIPVVMMTGCDDADMIVSALHQGPDQVLLKPVDPARLRRVLDCWLLRSGHIASGTSTEPPVAGSSSTSGAAERSERSETLRPFEGSRRYEKLAALGCLIGGVAHDFNNLLTVILGHAEMCAERPDTPDEWAQGMKAILDAGGRAQKLTRQLLGVGRADLFVPRTVSLNKAIPASLRMYRRLIGEDIAIVFAAGSGNPMIEADVGQLDQVVPNLLINARDAINAAGAKANRWIRIQTDLCLSDDLHRDACKGLKPGPWAALTISDSGTGMDPATAGRIFEPFFTTKAGDAGTGQGLSTVHGIVKQNNGHISISSSPGEGATFTIYWPQSQARSPAGDRCDAEPKVDPAGTETILLVEDENSLCFAIAASLTCLGYDVHTADSGETAVAILNSRNFRPDVLVTDVVLPGMNGLAVAGEARKRWPATSVIFMSGYSSDVAMRYGIRAEDGRLLQKPFRAHELAVEIRNVLDKDS